MAPFHVDLGLGGGQAVQPGLVGLAEVNGHLLHGGEDDEGIGVDLLGQHAGGEVLVDDRRRALEVVALGLVDRDAAAAAGHHHQSGVHHVADGLNLDDGLGLGRGHHTAVAPARVLNDVIAPLSHHFVGLLLGHEGADGLCGVLEGRVVPVYFHLGQHGGHALGDAAIQQLLPQRILEIIADIPLAHGHADGEGAGDVLLRLRAGQLGHGLLNHAHLGAVAVGDDDLVALLDQIHDGPGGLLHRDHLLRQIVAQGISAQGDDNTFTHE